MSVPVLTVTSPGAVAAKVTCNGEPLGYPPILFAITSPVPWTMGGIQFWGSMGCRIRSMCWPTVNATSAPLSAEPKMWPAVTVSVGLGFATVAGVGSPPGGNVGLLMHTTMPVVAQPAAAVTELPLVVVGVTVRVDGGDEGSAETGLGVVIGPGVVGPDGDPAIADWLAGSDPVAVELARLDDAQPATVTRATPNSAPRTSYPGHPLPLNTAETQDNTEPFREPLTTTPYRRLTWTRGR